MLTIMLMYFSLSIAAIACDVHTRPHYGTIACSGTSRGDTCTYKCDPGYGLNGPATTTCVGNDDNVMGKWNNTETTCQGEKERLSLTGHQSIENK